MNLENENKIVVTVELTERDCEIIRERLDKKLQYLMKQGHGGMRIEEVKQVLRKLKGHG